MKFLQIPLGQRFVLQGEVYLKVGPLTARRERDGADRLIPRSALVAPSQAGVTVAVPEVAALTDRLSRALDAYEEALRAVLLPAGGDSDPALREGLARGLAAARRAFEASLADSRGRSEGSEVIATP